MGYDTLYIQKNLSEFRIKHFDYLIEKSSFGKNKIDVDMKFKCKKR